MAEKQNLCSTCDQMHVGKECPDCGVDLSKPADPELVERLRIGQSSEVGAELTFEDTGDEDAPK